MSIIKPIAMLLLVAALQGCATAVLQEQRIQFSGENAEFTVVKTGCMIRRGQYTDKTGRGNASPYIKFIAVADDGRTLAQWRATCRAVAPNGTSDCDVSGDGQAFEGGGGMGCPDFQKFRIVMQ